MAEMLKESIAPTKSWPCPVCKKEFKSFQAMKGHQSHHKRSSTPKSTAAPKKVVVPTFIGGDTSGRHLLHKEKLEVLMSKLCPIMEQTFGPARGLVRTAFVEKMKEALIEAGYPRLKKSFVRLALEGGKDGVKPYTSVPSHAQKRIEQAVLLMDCLEALANAGKTKNSSS